MNELQREHVNSKRAWADALFASGRVDALTVLRGEICQDASAAWDTGQDAYGNALLDEAARIDELIAALAAREAA